MNSDLIKSAGILLGGVLATIAPYIASWIKKRFHKNEEANTFLHNAEYRVKINEVLVEIRTLSGANRAVIFEYHNGNAAINGLPFNYASMTYEKTDQTTREMLMNFQKLPISPICELLLDVQTTEEDYVRVDALYKHQGVVEFNKFHGIDTAYVFRIGEHIKAGTIHLMWINTAPILGEDLLNELHFKVMYINELMNKMRKY